MVPHIKQNTEVFTIAYPEAEEFTRTQLTKCFWSAEEVQVEKDIHDILTNCTESERHGIFTVLKLFTLYELKAGADYWTGRFMRSFPRHEIAAMGSAFGMMELCVHKPFYNKINELLNATDNTFYTSYVDNPVLKERMEFIDSIINHPDDLVSLAGFSMVEGVILYSSFAFLKHFQSCGKNKLMNVVRGINFSVRDENLHSIAGAWVYRTLDKQTQKQQIVPEDLIRVAEIYECAEKIYEHEIAIVDMIFEKGRIEGISPKEMYFFIQRRINLCLENLGLNPLFEMAEMGLSSWDTISQWFYKGINNYQMNDFFTGGGREYSRDWQIEKFTW